MSIFHLVPYFFGFQVSELAPLRSLLECVRDAALRPVFGVQRLCDLAQQICRAMSYLEERSLVHGDLGARNVLVFSKDKVRASSLISDHPSRSVSDNSPLRDLVFSGESQRFRSFESSRRRQGRPGVEQE